MGHGFTACRKTKLWSVLCQGTASRLLKNSVMLAFEGAHLQVRRCKTLFLSFRGTSAPRNLLFLSDSCFIALLSQDQDRRVAGYGIGSGATRQQNLSIPFHQVLVNRRHFRVFIRLCRRLQNKETDADYQQRHILIILSLAAALIARYPFAAAARSPLRFR